jgi:signal transduction histidine kinase
MNLELLEHILDVSRRLAETRALTPLLNHVIVEALDLVGAERGYLVLSQPNGSLDFRVARHYNGTVVEQADDQISRAVLAQTLTQRAPLILSDAMNDPNFNQSHSVNFLKLRSVMCVPLIARGNTIGAIYVENRTIRNRFTAENLPPLVLFANQIAVTIENAALNDELEARVATRTQELEEERAQLARRVAERTAELSAANLELIRASRLKDEFLATVSHELRTPLTAILNLTEALQLEIYGELTPRQLKASQSILRSGQHLLHLINDVLDLAKIEAGALELQMSHVILKPLCQASLELVSEQAIRKQIQIRFDYDDTVIGLLADERRLKQVLVNLLDNAIKFTPEASRIGLQVTGHTDQNLVELTVWDTGIGIAPTDQELLFQPFVQLDSGLTRKFGGSGLGLAIVKRIVDMQGGQITVESKPNLGSRFTVCLPWKPLSVENRIIN